MKHPAFQNLPRTFFFTGICLLVGLAIFVSLIGLIPVRAGILIFDVLILGFLFGCISLLIWYVVCFADLAGNNNLQRFINHSALVILAIVVWLGADYLFLYVFFSDDDFHSITKCIPMEIVFGILIFTSLIRFYSNTNIKSNSLEDDSEGNEKKQNSPKSELEGMDRTPVSTMQWIEKITVKVGQKIYVIAITDIVFLQAEGDYVMIHTAAGHFIKEQTMKYFEEHLPPAKFVRIHRSTIVNINMISRIELYEKQFYQITLLSGQQLKVSASGYRLLKNTLQL
jgi:Response regulator of the LytR/AlgR family